MYWVWLIRILIAWGRPGMKKLALKKNISHLIKEGLSAIYSSWSRHRNKLFFPFTSIPTPGLIKCLLGTSLAMSTMGGTVAFFPDSSLSRFLSPLYPSRSARQKSVRGHFVCDLFSPAACNHSALLSSNWHPGIKN